MLLNVVKKTLSPLISLFIFVLGNGFFATLLAIKLSKAEYSDLSIGAMTGFFYAGLMLASFRIEPLINRIGHIRAYAAFASMLAVLCMLHGMFFNLWFWYVLRFLGGIATAGLYVVIESWLLCESTPKTRGQVLSLYMVTFYASQSAGQFILKAGSPETLFLFALVSMLCSLSVIPLALTKGAHPEFDEPSTLGIKALYKASPSGLFGCFCAGIIMAVIYGLFPVLFHQVLTNKSDIALFMFAIIFGGMLLQYPIGHLSDVVERRLVLIGICVATIATTIGMDIFINQRLVLLGLCALLGGFTFTLYPISISYACDNLDNKDIVAGTQGLLLSYSFGAMMGPFLAPIMSELIGSRGLFLFIGMVSLLLAVLFVWRTTQTDSPPQEEPFVTMVQTTPIMAELDPRGEDSAQVVEKS